MSGVKEAAQSGLRIRALGAFEVAVDGTAIQDAAWPRQKTKQLLKVLLTAPGDVFTVDQLIDALLPSAEVDRAVSNIQARISELRRTLEPDLLKGSDSRYVRRIGEGYVFSLGPCSSLDTVSFERETTEAHRLAGENRWTEAVETFEEALALYHGEFLAEDRYAEWTLAPREHWRERYSAAITHLAEGYAHLGDFHRAAIACRAAFDLQPSREPVLRQLMSYHYAVGDRGEALRIYQIGVDALKNELDVAPSAETEALHNEILQQVPPAEQVAYDKKRVAVLPMISVSPDPGDEYFADGMTEELIYALSQVRELRVIAQTSSLAYKNTRKTVSQIGRELSVGTLVEGSVRKVGDDIRVVVQLIDAQDQEHLWAHEYDLILKDVLATQSQIAQDVANALEVELLEVERLREKNRGTEHFEAYTLYLKGRHYLDTDGGLGQATASYERALDIDPDYALAYAGLAEANCLRAIWSGDLDAFTRADEAARKALALAGELPEAHTALGLVTWLKDRNPERAEGYFMEAIALAPENAEAHHWYGQLLDQLERPGEAVVEVLKAHEVDPLSRRFNFTLGTMLIMGRRFDDAISRFEKALEIDPGFLSARIWLGRTKQVAWDWEGSEEAYRKAVEADPENPGVHQWLSAVLLSVGRYGEALAEMKRALELAEEPYSRSFNYNQGLGYYLLGKYDLALDFMKDAAEGFTQALWGLGWIYNELGEYEKALAALEKAEETLGGSFFYPRSWQSVWIDCNRGVAYARMGEEKKARQQLARMRENPAPRTGALCIAVLYFVLGSVDLGFEWLDKSVEQHNGMLMHVKNLPTLDPVRSDPRYLAVLERMGLPP